MSSGTQSRCFQPVTHLKLQVKRHQGYSRLLTRDGQKFLAMYSVFPIHSTGRLALESKRRGTTIQFEHMTHRHETRKRCKHQQSWCIIDVSKDSEWTNVILYPWHLTAIYWARLIAIHASCFVLLCFSLCWILLNWNMIPGLFGRPWASLEGAFKIQQPLAPAWIFLVFGVSRLKTFPPK